MAKYTVPTPKQAEIIRRNGLDPDDVTVALAGKDFIQLLNYHTRDTIIIHRGDKEW